MSAVQVETERDVNLLTGQEIVRVKFRPEGVRKWTRFVVFPDPDQSVEELLTQGPEIAAAYMAARDGAS